MVFWEILAVHVLRLIVSVVLSHIWDFIADVDLFHYKRQILKRRLQELSCLEEDVTMQLRITEFRTGKKRKQVIQDWLENVESMKNDAWSIEQDIGDRKYSLEVEWYLRLRTSIEKVNKLHEEGHFSGDLVVEEVDTTTNLLTTHLLFVRVGVLERIEAALTQSDIVGVYGVEGVGKTAIMMHFNNQLRESGTFGNVYWVSASGESSVLELQSCITTLLTGTTSVYGRAEPWRGRKQNCVFILDGVESRLDAYEIGISSRMSECKLVIISRSYEVCGMLGCKEPIEIEPLSDIESELLFKYKVGLKEPLHPEVEEIVKLIVKECERLPLKIINVAKSIRGMQEICEWRNTLDELRQCKR